MQTSRQIEWTFLLMDLLVLMASLPLAHELREFLTPWIPALRSPVPFPSYGHLVALFLPTWLYCAAHFRLHRVSTLLGSYLALLRSLLATQLWGLAFIAFLLVSLQIAMNRSLILAFFGVSTLLLLLVARIQRSILFARRQQDLALVVGKDPDERRIDEVKWFRGRTVEILEGGGSEALRRRLKEGSIQEVILLPGWSKTEIHALVRTAEEVGVPALVGVEELDLELARPRAITIGATLYHAYETVRHDQLALFAKAILDRVFALVACVLLSPLFAITALVIRLDSKGPVFFKQIRGGLHGRPFLMLKFRTMRTGAETERERLLEQNEMDGPVFKIRSDPRITRIGRFLRRTSLDELPQLVNVLLGQMSLVGPRPLPMIETSWLKGAQRRRMSMLPGLTCLWQVSGRSEIGFEQWMALDLEYIDRWSLWLDFLILLRTIPTVLMGRGAV